MRAPALLAVFAMLVLAGCGSAKIVAPKPETVIGSVPKQTAPATTSTSAATTTATTTAAGGGGGGGGAASGKALFASNGCGSCHTFKAAGASGKIGPDLDKLSQYAKQAKQPLDKFVSESITDPKAYVQSGYQPIMPSFSSLSKPQVDALVQFLTKGS
jgi:cytochrome c551/c552